VGAFLKRLRRESVSKGNNTISIADLKRILEENDRLMNRPTPKEAADWKELESVLTWSYA